MDLQLYRVDENNYLVDFRNVGYYHSSPDPHDFERVRRASEHDHSQHTTLPSGGATAEETTGSSIASKIVSNGLVGDVGASMNNVDLLPGESPMISTTDSAGKPTAGGAGKIKEVCSPFLFLEAACRLIVELASP